MTPGFRRTPAPARLAVAGCPRAGRPATRPRAPVPPFLDSRRLRAASGSVAGRLVADRQGADGLAVADAEIVRQDGLVGQVGLVELAVVGAADDGVAMVIEDLADVDADLVVGHLLGHPATDGFDADELTAGVVDVGVLGESFSPWGRHQTGAMASSLPIGDFSRGEKD